MASWEQIHLKSFRKLEFCANLWQKHTGTNKDAKRVNKSSYRTSSSTPGAPKLPAVHVQTRSITTGGCSPENTRRTMSKEGQTQKLSGCLTVPFVSHPWPLSRTFAQDAAGTEARRTDWRVKSRCRSGATIKVKCQTAAREQLPVHTFKI